jgi:hypothetical protein
MFEGLVHCRVFFHENLPEDFIYVEVNRVFEKLMDESRIAGKRVTETTPGTWPEHGG